MEKQKKQSSFISKLITWIFGILIFVVLLIEGYGFISARSNHDVPNFFGYQMLVIQTDSMDTGPDTYPIGMGIIAKKIDYSLLKKPEGDELGDIITFYRPSDASDERVVTHRIIDIETDADGLVFICLGDNLQADTCPPGGCTLSHVDIVKEKDVMGLVVSKSPLLGKVYGAMSKPIVMFLLVLLPLGVLVVISAIDFVKALKTKEEVAEGKPSFSQEDVDQIKQLLQEQLLEDMKKERQGGNNKDE